MAQLPQNETPGRASVGLESIGVLDADVLLMAYPTGGREFLESNPVFQQLPAVRAGRYIPLPTEVSAAIAFPSALSIPFGLERISAAIAAVLD